MHWPTVHGYASASSVTASSVSSVVVASSMSHQTKTSCSWARSTIRRKFSANSSAETSSPSCEGFTEMRASSPPAPISSTSRRYVSASAFAGSGSS